MGCGTGACAASVASNLYKSTNGDLTVDLEGGKIRTIYNKEEIYLIGNSEMIYKGEIGI